MYLYVTFIFCFIAFSKCYVSIIAWQLVRTKHLKDRQRHLAEFSGNKFPTDVADVRKKKVLVWLTIETEENYR